MSHGSSNFSVHLGTQRGEGLGAAGCDSFPPRGFERACVHRRGPCNLAAKAAANSLGDLSVSAQHTQELLQYLAQASRAPGLHRARAHVGRSEFAGEPRSLSQSNIHKNCWNYWLKPLEPQAFTARDLM